MEDTAEDGRDAPPEEVIGDTPEDNTVWGGLRTGTFMGGIPNDPKEDVPGAPGDVPVDAAMEPPV